MSFEQFESLSLYVGIGTLVAYMMFVVWDLAKTEKAGWFATLVLFSSLGLGVFGFALKIVIGEILIA